MRLQFTILGDAIPQGSLKARVPKGWTRAVVTSDNPRLRDWRILVGQAAQIALLALPGSDRAMAAGGVRLTVAFYLPRPKSLAKKQTAHRKRPDIDKLVRSVADSLTSICYTDDAQICELIALKRYAAAGQPARVDVTVEDTTGTMQAIKFVNVDYADALPLLDAGPRAH